MMIIKFAMVAWYFMHLKSDSRLFSPHLRLGHRAGLVVYIIVLLTFHAIF